MELKRTLVEKSQLHWGIVQLLSPMDGGTFAITSRKPSAVFWSDEIGSLPKTAGNEKGACKSASQEENHEITQWANAGGGCGTLWEMSN
jgi:hypothetical protein